MKKENLKAVVPGSQVAAEWSLIKDGNFVTFEVKGDSMDDGTADSYKDGEILICKPVEGGIQINQDYVSSLAVALTYALLNKVKQTVSLADVEVYKVIISQRQR